MSGMASAHFIAIHAISGRSPCDDNTRGTHGNPSASDGRWPLSPQRCFEILCSPVFFTTNSARIADGHRRVVSGTRTVPVCVPGLSSGSNCVFLRSTYELDVHAESKARLTCMVFLEPWNSRLIVGHGGHDMHSKLHRLCSTFAVS